MSYGPKMVVVAACVVVSILCCGLAGYGGVKGVMLSVCLLVFVFGCLLVLFNLVPEQHNAPRGSAPSRRSYSAGSPGYKAHNPSSLGGSGPTLSNLLRNRNLVHHAGRLGWDQDRQQQVCRDFVERNKHGLDFDTFVEDEAMYEEGGIVDMLGGW